MIPNLKPGQPVVWDNAPYHNKSTFDDKAPSKSWNKAAKLYNGLRPKVFTLICNYT